MAKRSQSMRTGFITVLLLCPGMLACDPAIGAGISVAPRPGMAADSARKRALRTAEIIARRYDLVEGTNLPYVAQQGWWQCFSGGGVRLCDKTSNNAVELLIAEFLTTHLSSRAERLRRELLDSLRAQTDSQSVRQCDWNPRMNSCSDTLQRKR